MRVLVACEFSGVVRREFAHRGHDAWSCDLLPAEDGSNKHIVGDVRDILDDGWDMLMVAHPPCTRLCNSGVRWLTAPPPGKTKDQMWDDLREGADLFSTLLNNRIPRKCIENPVMHKHAKALIRNYREFTQSVQPWMFGHGEAKRTCFWLEELPPLEPQFETWEQYRAARALPPEAKPEPRVHHATPGPDRWKIRSRFFPGIAAAMAEQWGGIA
jgi:hypothetical protein